MNQQHPFDKLTEAQSDERNAREHAEELVARVRSVAERLVNWKQVGFLGTDSKGTIRVPNLEVKIRFDEMPSMENIDDAIQSWVLCRNKADSVKSQLTHDQLQTLRQSLD